MKSSPPISKEMAAPRFRLFTERMTLKSPRLLPVVAFLAAGLVSTIAASRTRAVRIIPPGPSPTFSNEVVRIFQDHCQSCHHPGDIAPFSLMTYADAKPWATNIKIMTESRQMPPWKPVQSCSAFEGERVMTDAEIATLAKWADAGAPEGDRGQLPQPLEFSSDWRLGPPDLVLSYPQTYTPPGNQDTYRCFPLPTNLPSDRYVSAIDIHPGDRQTVHHVLAFIDTKGAAANLDQQDPGAGYTCFGGPGFSVTDPSAGSLGGWVPGAQPVRLDDGVAMSLPANSSVVLQVHYHPSTTAPKPDATQIGIYFAKKAPQKLLRFLPLINDTFTIPPGDANYPVSASFTVPFFVNAHVVEIAPHMHLLGRNMTVQALYPDGSSECLVNVNQWDFNWQGLYKYRTPVAIPGGTTVSLMAHYDNSEDNPRNPNYPPKPVSWGEATTDEMCIAFLGITLDAENLTSGKVADTSWMPPMAGR